jgi:hypothetical protein
VAVIPLDFAIRATERPPDGRAASYAFAGWDPKVHLQQDGRPAPFWEAVNIVRVLLPEPLDYLDGRQVTRVSVNKRVAPNLQAALRSIYADGLWRFLSPYGGGYEFRRIGGSDKLSLHSLGLALDFDPAANPRDGKPDESRFGASGEGRAVVRLFELHGWYWGGRFESRPDAMHFQFATGV